MPADRGVAGQLGWLAGQLESPTIKLGTMVTNPVTRDPIVLASALAQIH